LIENSVCYCYFYDFYFNVIMMFIADDAIYRAIAKLSLKSSA
jgi:hypothetical protein